MRFSWSGLIVAPLFVPLVFAAAMTGLMQGSGPRLLPFIILLVPACVISYGLTTLLLLPVLFLTSLWRPNTGLTACLFGLVLGAAVVVPMTWLEWHSSGPDSGPPTESFWVFFLRWSADPMTAIFPVAGLVTAGLYWWIGTWRRSRSPKLEVQ